MDDATRERHKLRLEVLRKIYEISGADTKQFVNAGKLAEALGAMDDSKPLASAVQYLVDEGLVKGHAKRFGGIPGLLTLEHAGLKEMEASDADREHGTQHFPAQNVLYVGTMVNSTIQQGIGSTQTSTQTVTLSSDAKQKIGDYAIELENALPNLHLKQDAIDELKAELATIKAQIASPKPKVGILREALSTVREVLTHAGGVVVGYSIYHRIPELIAMLPFK